MTFHPSNRRRFLQVVAASGALATTGAVVGCTSRAGGASGQIAAGKATAYPLGSLHVVSGQPICIGHDAGGLYAMTLICPHAGCDMANQGTVSVAGVYCSCHGSYFDVDGNVTHGPANSPLEHYDVIVDPTGNVVVDADTTVDAATRTPV